MRTLLGIALIITQSLSAQTPVDRAMQDVTAVIVHDVFSAPAASRIYAYTAIAAYEAGRWGDTTMPSLCTKVQQMPCMSAPNDLEISDHGLAAAYAAYLTARAFIFSEDMLMEKCRAALGAQFDTASGEYIYACFVSETIIGWSKTDGYAASRILPRYTLKDTPSAWEPTPPDYADAVEPYWGTLRMFVIGQDTLQPLPPMPVFDSVPNSIWYAQAMEVIDIRRNLTPEQELIVQFWDDNPFTLIEKGHLHFAQKKVSPAGHWLDIARTALDSIHATPEKRAQVYAWVSIAMADAFIVAWRAKYTYETLRPETYINRYIDASWRPYLQSPPFPEYPSGHSTVSAAAATILTYFFGEEFDFADGSETSYNLPVRTFTSFEAAAEEAGISRIYGGIHFRSPVSVGKVAGKRGANHQLSVFTR